MENKTNQRINKNAMKMKLPSSLKKYVKSPEQERLVKSYLRTYLGKKQDSMVNYDLNFLGWQFYCTIYGDTRNDLLEEEFLIDVESFQDQQSHITTEVFDYLRQFWGMQYTYKYSKNERFKNISHSVLSLCMLNRDRWRATFKEMHDNLMDSEYFLFHCYTTVPRKGYLYFYYYLQRFAVIFEMALYCYEHGHNYFKAGAYVLSFIDFHDFVEAGGYCQLLKLADWMEKLTHPMRLVVAYPKYEFKSLTEVIREEEFPLNKTETRELSRPLQLKYKLESFPDLIKKLQELAPKVRPENTIQRQSVPKVPKYKLRCFRDVIDKLEEFASKGKIGILPRELDLLLELERVINSKDKGSGVQGILGNQTSTEVGVSNDVLPLNGKKLARRILIDYFKETMAPDLPVDSSSRETHNVRIGLDFWVNSDVIYSTAFQYFQKLQRSYEIPDMDEDDFNFISRYFESFEPQIESNGKNSDKLNRKEPIYQSSTDNKTSAEEATPSKQLGKCIPIDTKYVEDILEVFYEILPLFFDDYLDYLYPYNVSDSESSSSDAEGNQGFYIVLEDEFFWERTCKIFIPHASKRMVGFKLPFQNIVSIVPLEVQKALDSYIINGVYTVFSMDPQQGVKTIDAQWIAIAGTDSNHLVFHENRPVWVLVDESEIGYKIHNRYIEVFGKLFKNSGQFDETDQQANEAADLIYAFTKIPELREVSSEMSSCVTLDSQPNTPVSRGKTKRKPQKRRKRR